MPPRKDVGGCEGGRGTYALEQQDVIGGGNEEDASARLGRW